MSTKTFWMIILLTLFVAVLPFSACGTDGASSPTGASTAFDADGAPTMALGPISTVRAGRPVPVPLTSEEACLDTAEYSFREAMDSVEATCAAKINTELFTAVVRMCPAWSQTGESPWICPPETCDATQWHLACAKRPIERP